MCSGVYWRGKHGWLGAVIMVPRCVYDDLCACVWSLSVVAFYISAAFGRVAHPWAKTTRPEKHGFSLPFKKRSTELWMKMKFRWTPEINFTANNVLPSSELKWNPNELISDRTTTTIADNKVTEPHQSKQIPQQPTQSRNLFAIFLQWLML